LLIGTNDLEDQAEPEVAAENLRLIIAQLKQHSATMPVVLCRVFPSSASKKRPMEKIVKLNALYDAIAREEPQITILDTWALFAGPHGDARESEFPDLLHPNAVGNAKWAAALRPILETLGLMPAWPDDFTPETGFESLFNGRDLSGWGYADGPKLDGQTATGDGRYVARNGRLIVTVSRQQRDYKKLWTTRTFPKDFVLILEVIFICLKKNAVELIIFYFLNRYFYYIFSKWKSFSTAIITFFFIFFYRNVNFIFS